MELFNDLILTYVAEAIPGFVCQFKRWKYKSFQEP